MSTLNATENSKSDSSKKVKKAPKDEMFRDATKGQILICGETRHKITKVDRDTIGNYLLIKPEKVVNEENPENPEKKKSGDDEVKKVYFSENYLSLRHFVKDFGMETLPGSNDFEIVDAVKNT